MATSKFIHDSLGEVTIVRRRGLKYISIRVDHSGTVRLNLPWFVPKTTGLSFLTKKQDWIKQQLSKKVIRADSYEISGHRIILEQTAKKRSALIETSGKLTLQIPGTYSRDKKKSAVDKLLANYLRLKTEEIIVPETNVLAEHYGYKPHSISVNKLKSRWGSCDHKGNIKLSLYLYSLPEDLWKYVISHELAHLSQLNHSRHFWNEVEQMYPSYKIARKSLKNHSPGVYLV